MLVPHELERFQLIEPVDVNTNKAKRICTRSLVGERSDIIGTSGGSMIPYSPYTDGGVIPTPFPSAANKKSVLD